MSWKEITVKNHMGKSSVFEINHLFTNEEHLILMREIPGKTTTSLTNMIALVMADIFENHWLDQPGFPPKFIQYTAGEKAFPEQTLDWVWVDEMPAGKDKVYWKRLTKEERQHLIEAMKKWGDDPYVQGDPMYSPLDYDWLDRMIEREG